MPMQYNIPEGSYLFLIAFAEQSNEGYIMMHLMFICRYGCITL